jgi:hypothetical protein
MATGYIWAVYMHDSPQSRVMRPNGTGTLSPRTSSLQPYTPRCSSCTLNFFNLDLSYTVDLCFLER